MEESNVLDILQLLLSKKESLESLESLDKNIYDTTVTLIKQLENYESIDKEMVVLLNDMFSNDLIKKHKYSDITKAIAEGSTVVYFKSAQLFKVYTHSELETLLGGQLRTIYKQLNESYEMISHESKQKIVMLGDITLVDRIERIKTYIVDFMESEGFSEFSENDIVCYKGKEALEIIINDYYVENQKEHDEIVQRLLAYILQHEKNSNITRKIDTSSYSEFDGMKMVPMPTDKELIATKYIEPLLTMVSNVQKCSGYKSHITLNVTIDNSITNNTTIHESSETDSTNVYEFIKHIRVDKPSWYVENTWVRKDILIEHYHDMYEAISKRAFSMMFKDKIYKMEKRQFVNKNRQTFVKLLKFSEL
jgi:hypothetical protein